MLAGLFSVQGNPAQSFLLTIGVAAIVGMFSQQAIEKLKQISEAILTKVPPAADQKPKPISLTAVDPSKGSTNGKEPVKLIGTGFAAGATVTFGGAAATDVKVTNGEQIDARTPGHAAGKVDVEVCNPDSGLAKKAGGFEYVDTPPAGNQGPAAVAPGPPAAAPAPPAVAPALAPPAPAPSAGAPAPPAVAPAPAPAGGPVVQPPGK
jgi:hypothetical protein